MNKNKLKVCIVSAILPPAYGGAEVAAFNYAKRLNSDPHSQAIIIGWDRTGAYEKNKIKHDFVYPIQFSENTVKAKGIGVYFQQYHHLWKCFWALSGPMWSNRKEYDFLHNFNSGFAFNRVSILIAKLLGKKVITETSLVGDDDPLSLGRFAGWKDYLKPKFVRYLFYKLADRYVSKSNVITEIFEKSAIPMRKVVQIPYSVDISKFAPVEKEKKKEIRKKLEIWEDGLIIIFAGGINIRKGVHTLVDAFITIEKKYPDVKLLIVGPTYKYDQKYISDIKEKIKIAGLEKKIHFTKENVSNVEEYMQSSDIFVLPSIKEGFPISIIEAMSCGLAVIGSDIAEIAKAQIINGQDGYTFPVGDSAKLALTIENLIKDKNNISRIGQEARKKAVENWSTGFVDNEYKKLYQSLSPESNYRNINNVKLTGEKIKILYTIPNFNTAGSGKALLNVISRIDKNKFAVEICCRHKKGSLFNSAEELKVPIHISDFTVSMKPKIKGIKNVWSLSRFLKKINPDIIHSYNYSDDYSEALASKISGIKWVYTKKNMSWNSNAWKMRTKLADAIVPQNQQMVENFFNNINKQHLIPIGIDVNEFSNIKRDESIILKYSLSDAYPVILTIANVIPIKGIDYLIKGFNLALKDYEKAKLLIVGEDKTEFGDILKKEVEKSGMEGKVIFTGKQNDVKSFYSIADIFILSSTKKGEGGPISVLEAMASGILCYGSDVPGIRDQFREFRDQLFEPEKPKAIADKILNAMSMSDEVKMEKILRQREFIKKYYSIENEVERLEELYINLIEQ
ncbi:MAG: glycosyltransferase [Bacteroidota bacterium]|nr:glycosyltransferase [Bacteroidota bacterium]